MFSEKIVKKGNNLYIMPCVPSSWNSFAVEYKYQDTLYDSIKALLSHGWKILFTIRSAYLDNFTKYVLRTDYFDEVYIPRLDEELYIKHNNVV